MMNYLSIILAVLIGLGIYSENHTETLVSETDNLYSTMLSLGYDNLNHELNSTIPGVSAEKGRELFLTGYITHPNGWRPKKQSKHYVCTSCHNNVREDYDISNPTPESRLNYAVENDLPLLQGTTLHGVVNRVTFYNGDYDKKYGKETVDKVKENLRESIQLCAVGCAQGRALGTWEIESVLAYFWTLQLKIGDLDIDASEMKLINDAIRGDADKDLALEILKSKYSDAAPCTFVEPPSDYEEGYALEGNPDRGKEIYEISCLHCHEDGRYSYYTLGRDDLSLNHLERHFGRKNSPFNAYNLITKGTLPIWGNKAYMPQYPAERLSKQQIEDLRAYVSQPE